MKSMLCVLCLVLVSCKSGTPGGGSTGAVTALNTDQEKALYAIGGMFGSQVERLELDARELAIVAQGFQDSAGKKPMLIDPRTQQTQVQDFFKERMMKVSEKAKKEGEEFINKFAAEPGVQKTASGLAYKINNPGSDVKPKETDTVEVHYHGTLVDGTVFDSSKEQGKPVSFPLNRVIRGWTEGLQLIGEGGSARLVIPADLAYGENGAPPKIPGGATLIFDVELIKVQKEAAPAVAPAPANPAAAKAAAAPEKEKAKKK